MKVAIEPSIARGSRFLASQRGADGLWSDFRTYAGESVDWVSGHVLVSAVGVLEPGLHAAALRALVRRQRTSGGWGYDRNIPEDADTTAFALRAMAGGWMVPPHARRAATNFLRCHQLAHGGYTTFARLDAIGRVIGEGDLSMLRGWGSAHPCVTANVILALLDTGVPATSPEVSQAVEYLLAARGSDGLWMSYWWQGPTFATYHVRLVLARTARMDGALCHEVADALLTVRGADGGWGDRPSEPSHAHATALALSTLALGADVDVRVADVARKAIGWLVKQQCGDGSWPSVPILRVVDPRQHHGDDEGPPPPGTGVVVADHRRIYTTATVLHALQLCRRTIALEWDE